MGPTADFEGARRGVPPTGERLETVRLTLRRFVDSDVGPFLTYRNDPEVAKYQSWDSCTKQEAIDLARDATLPGTPGQWVQFAVELTAYCIDIDPHTPCIYEWLSKTLRRDGMYTSCVAGQPH